MHQAFKQSQQCRLVQSAMSATYTAAASRWCSPRTGVKRCDGESHSRGSADYGRAARRVQATKVCGTCIFTVKNANSWTGKSALSSGNFIPNDGKLLSLREWHLQVQFPRTRLLDERGIFMAKLAWSFLIPFPNPSRGKKK